MRLANDSEIKMIQREADSFFNHGPDKSLWRDSYGARTAVMEYIARRDYECTIYPHIATTTGPNLVVGQIYELKDLPIGSQVIHQHEYSYPITIRVKKLAGESKENSDKKIEIDFVEYQEFYTNDDGNKVYEWDTQDTKVRLIALPDPGNQIQADSRFYALGVID